jgi:hypothetical protein
VIDVHHVLDALCIEQIPDMVVEHMAVVGARTDVDAVDHVVAAAIVVEVADVRVSSHGRIAIGLDQSFFGGGAVGHLETRHGAVPSRRKTYPVDRTG